MALSGFGSGALFCAVAAPPEIPPRFPRNPFAAPGLLVDDLPIERGQAAPLPTAYHQAMTNTDAPTALAPHKMVTLVTEGVAAQLNEYMLPEGYSAVMMTRRLVKIVRGERSCHAPSVAEIFVSFDEGNVVLAPQGPDAEWAARIISAFTS